MKKGTIQIYNELTKKAIVAYVLRQDENVLRVAVNGEPITLMRVSPLSGDYECRVAGMTLTTKKP